MVFIRTSERADEMNWWRIVVDGEVWCETRNSMEAYDARRKIGAKADLEKLVDDEWKLQDK